MSGGPARLIAAALLLLVCGSPAGAQETAVRVTLRPQRLTPGEVTELTFQVDSGALRAPRFQPAFALENLRVVGGPSRRDSMTWVNGSFRRVIGLSWYLTAERIGRGRVRSIEVDLGQGKVPLPDQEVWIEAEAAADDPTPSSPPPADPYATLFRDLLRPGWSRQLIVDPAVLLRAELSAEQPWAGQQFLYTLYLLIERRREGEGRLSAETIFPRRVPPFQGFWAQEVPLPESGRAELVELDGKLWWRQAVLQRALFAYEPGDHPIEAAEVDLRLVYFRPLGFGLGEEPVRPPAIRRTSNAPRVTVRALPPAPPGFGGAVGQFRARAQLGPAEVRAEEASVLTVELVGSGNLSGLRDPELPPLPGVERSAAQEASRQAVVDGSIESSRSWAWTLVPQTTGRWQVPAASWVTFDPVAGAYHTVATTPQPLVATPAAPRPQVPATTVRPSTTAPSWWRGFLPAFVAGVGAAVAATIVLLSWRRRGRRDRPARRRLLARLGAALAEPQPRQAAGAAEEAWREFLGARFSCPPDTQPAQWPRLFAAQGMQPGLAGELLRLFADLHYLRYAPQLASTDSLQRELLERSRRLARRLA